MSGARTGPSQAVKVICIDKGPEVDFLCNFARAVLSMYACDAVHPRLCMRWDHLFGVLGPTGVPRSQEIAPHPKDHRRVVGAVPQGYLAHTKPPHPRTLQKACA